MRSMQSISCHCISALVHPIELASIAQAPSLQATALSYVLSDDKGAGGMGVALSNLQSGRTLSTGTVVDVSPRFQELCNHIGVAFRASAHEGSKARDWWRCLNVDCRTTLQKQGNEVCIPLGTGNHQEREAGHRVGMATTIDATTMIEPVYDSGHGAVASCFRDTGGQHMPECVQLD